MNQCFAPSNPRRVRHLAIVLMVVTATLGGLIAAPISVRALPGLESDGLRCAAPEPGPFPDLDPAGGEPSNATNDSATQVTESRPGPAATPSAATPQASPVASPVADDGTALASAAIERVVRTIAVCQTESRVKTFSRFVTERFLGDVYAGGGSITREQFVELAPDLPKVPVEIVSVTNIDVDPDGTATADVVSIYGRQLIRARWSFVFVRDEGEDATGDEEAFGAWWPDGLTPLTVEPPDGARPIDVELDDNAYDPASLRVRGPDIVISARNRGDDDHELLVLSLRHDVTTRDLLTAPGPALPNGVTVIGQLTVPAGAEGQLVLVGLERGEYVIVDLLPSADGTPHLALGMEATLTVR